jgi:hypothetical protein
VISAVFGAIAVIGLNLSHSKSIRTSAIGTAVCLAGVGYIVWIMAK